MSVSDVPLPLALARVRQTCQEGDARAIRLAAGLTLGEIARHLEVDPGTISRWERGERRPTGDVARRYLALLLELRSLRL